MSTLTVGTASGVCLGARATRFGMRLRPGRGCIRGVQATDSQPRANGVDSAAPVRCHSPRPRFRLRRGVYTVRILLTGHKGYIGSVLGPLLREQGHDVVGLDSGLFES